jgi:alkylated DNA repair dioxygenase AlkB
VSDGPAIDTSVEFERFDLGDGSWIDIARGWMQGTDVLYRELEASMPWRQGRVWRYEKWVEEPRLGAGFSIRNPPHPVFADVRTALAAQYKARFDGFGLAYYRDRRDSVAMHRDREMKWLDDTVVAILTTGAQRPFLIQKKGSSYERDDARDLRPASGDLMVFGGRFQADWLHGVPKVRHAVRGRISVQMRHTSGRGRPEMTPTYYAPRNFSKGRT